MYALCAFLALANLEVSPITPPEPPPSASRHWPTGPPTANGFHHTLIRLTSTSENHSFSYVAWSCCGPLVYIAIHFAYRTPSSLVPAVVHPPPTARPSTPPLHTTEYRLVAHHLLRHRHHRKTLPLSASTSSTPTHPHHTPLLLPVLLLVLHHSHPTLNPCPRPSHPLLASLSSHRLSTDINTSSPVETLPKASLL
ncbi:hypothetical protein C8034_v003023 [Colletotrichum sidae]|uniref:Uncharacterized protein n=1 Tax=Colletotrichum sidae TaxID=1347389 RepID=A0A4R8TAZ0_9PEZI|nr:hypothetical protein C8034_v003023 [Colletotrichum sidae]